jgi:hypothetical protein
MNGTRPRFNEIQPGNIPSAGELFISTRLSDALGCIFPLFLF